MGVLLPTESRDGSTLVALRRGFSAPHSAHRPTPFFWWSGSDLERDRLGQALDELQAKGIGGTIVGYSQKPNNDLDAGDPYPFTDAWWDLLVWFCEESRVRGMTVGVQDYGILGSVLREVGPRTASLGGGGLRNSTEPVRGPVDYAVETGDGTRIVSAIAWRSDDAAERLTLNWSADDGLATVSVPAGEWIVSVVTHHRGVIAGIPSNFDPLHPDSGALVIDSFYEPFAARLGPALGTSLTTIFQDELDFGSTMPLWNDEVESLLSGYQQDISMLCHALWHDVGEDTLTFRAAYRDAVVALLESNYFAPIFEWHEAHGTRMLMDQLSRGDLRLGAAHYADFMDTMKWYAGPGNDDPDLTGPRNVSAFAISSSLANLYQRPLVPSEAFHSSGWGVTPSDIVSGANVGFAAGANHLILHGLYYSTRGGWWEWASPDFHYRQPWWTHSASMWSYFSRVSFLLRSGVSARQVAVIDPSQDLVLSARDAGKSPERAREILEGLARRGVGADLVPPSALQSAVVADGQLRLPLTAYRVVIVPGTTRLRESTVNVLERFVAIGGVVIVAGPRPLGTELRNFEGGDLAGWTLLSSEQDDLFREVRGRIPLDFDPGHNDVIAAHRHFDDGELFFVVNAGQGAIDLTPVFAAPVASWCVELWDPWNDATRMLPSTPAQLADGKTQGVTVGLSLQPGESAVLVLRPIARGVVARSPEWQGRVTLDGPWTFRIEESAPISFGDFDGGEGPVGVQTVRVEESIDQGETWRSARVGYATRMHVLGPIPPAHRAEVDVLIADLTSDSPGLGVVLDGRRVEWRPYRFSERLGLENDPLLLDRNTGPHGLKGVPDEFLDPAAVDHSPIAGSLYYFRTTVEIDSDSVLVTAASRSPYSVWIDGRQVLSQESEVEPEYFAPWGLRDLTAEPTSRFVPGNLGRFTARASVVARVEVAAHQPTRMSCVVGGGRVGEGFSDRLRWWAGSSPAANFLPGPLNSASAWLRASVPPGARTALIRVHGVIESASEGGEPCDLASVERFHDSSTSYVIHLPSSTSIASRQLTLKIRPGAWRAPDAGLIDEPISWECSEAQVALKGWQELGLSDFSGRATYRTRFVRPDLFEYATLHVEGLGGSVGVVLNGVPVGEILAGYRGLDIPASAFLSVNSLEINAANTLNNFYDRLPTPYSSMQSPGGGFTGVTLDLFS